MGRCNGTFTSRGRCSSACASPRGRRELTGTGVVSPALGGQSSFATSRDRSESAFTPKVALRYDWSDAINFYASWAKGFKSGGFNEQVFNTTDESLEYA